MAEKTRLDALNFLQQNADTKLTKSRSKMTVWALANFASPERLTESKI